MRDLIDDAQPKVVITTSTLAEQLVGGFRPDPSSSIPTQSAKNSVLIPSFH
ncbi:hypothetical protein ACETU7_01805 [Rhodococcus sp. 3Y1]